jgi:hypothetical protein
MFDMITSLTTDLPEVPSYPMNPHGDGTGYARQLVEGIDCSISVVITPNPNPNLNPNPNPNLNPNGSTLLPNTAESQGSQQCNNGYYGMALEIDSLQSVPL